MQLNALIVGSWRGTYSYDAPEMQGAGQAGVGFDLLLTQTRWQRFWGRFAGSVADDPPFGVPHPGRIVGRVSRGRLRFAKLLPELHVAGPEGSMSLRDYLATHDVRLRRRIPHPPIRYEGSLAEDGSVSGTWSIGALTLPLDTDGCELRLPRNTGTFHMRKQQHA